MPTYTDLRDGFRLGPWEVLPDRGLLRDGETERHLEPKVIDVLVLLAAHDGQVVSKEQLIESVWDSRAQSDEPLNRCVYLLRKGLGDDPQNPTYVETIPRRGYRLKMPISLPDEPDEEPAKRGPYWSLLAAGALAVLFIFALARWPPWSEPPPDTPMRSVAVFPFQCPGGTEKYLCFMFSEELTSTLLYATSIKVVKGRSAFSAENSYQEMANQLGVDGLLTGSVQRMGDQIKISVELVDGRNGFVVFSDTLDGPVEDIFRLQVQVASIIEKSINGGSGQPLHAASEPSSFEAFEAYARGQYQFEVRDRESIEESIRLFQEAIRLDPLFGPAYLRLAYAYLLLPDYDTSIFADSMYELAAATTNAGVEADSSILQSAATVYGFIHHKRGEWLLATKAFETAVTAETVYPIAHHWYSRLLASVGRLDESLYHARRAYELDPDSAIIISRLAIANFWTGDLDMAERYFGMVSKMTLEAPIHDLAYAMFLIRKKRFGEAIVGTKRGLEKYGMDTAWVEPVFAGIEDPMMRDVAIGWIQQMMLEVPLPPFIPMTLSVMLGDADSAMKIALTIEDPGQSFFSEVLFIDENSDLRAHPDFTVLLERIALDDYWKNIGCEWVDGATKCSSKNHIGSD